MNYLSFGDLGFDFGRRRRRTVRRAPARKRKVAKRRVVKNSWQKFLKKHGGKGHSMAKLKRMYHKTAAYKARHRKGRKVRKRGTRKGMKRRTARRAYMPRRRRRRSRFGATTGNNYMHPGSALYGMFNAPDGYTLGGTSAC